MSVQYTAKQQRAYMLIYHAKQKGELVPSTACEVCDDTQLEIRAHHWRGYEYPLDVWWVCARCNALIPEHDGSITKEVARARLESSNPDVAQVVRQRWTTGDHINVADGTWDGIISVLIRAIAGSDNPMLASCHAMAECPEWQALTDNKRRVLVRAAQRHRKSPTLPNIDPKDQP